MLEIKKGKFIQVPNVAFAFGTEYKMSNDEMKVYAYLQWMKNVGNMNIRTHASIIVEDLGWMTSNKSRSLKRAVDSLNGLNEKGYITIEGEDFKKSPMTINIVEEMKEAEVKSNVEWKDAPFKFKGYTEVTAEDYNKVISSDYNITVIAYFNWRNNANFDYAICDKEWGEVLELSVRQTRVIIDSAKGFMTKISGEKYQDDAGQWKQETNMYEKRNVISDVKEIKVKNNSESYLDNQRKKVTDIRVSHDEKVFMQIFDKNTFFNNDGYRIWKDTKCKHTKEAGQKKVDAIQKNERGRYVIDRLERNYQSNILADVRGKEFSDRMIKELKEKETIEPTVRREALTSVTDISDFL